MCSNVYIITWYPCYYNWNVKHKSQDCIWLRSFGLVPCINNFILYLYGLILVLLHWVLKTNASQFMRYLIFYNFLASHYMANNMHYWQSAVHMCYKSSYNAFIGFSMLLTTMTAYCFSQMIKLIFTLSLW